MKPSSSSEDVVRVTEDLSECRNRLDAGIEENKRNRQVIQGLNDQLQRFRQRAQAESAESFNTALPHGIDLSIPSSIDNHASMPSLTIDIPLNANVHSARLYSGHPSYRNNRHKSLGTLGRDDHIPYRYRSSSPGGELGRNRSSPRLAVSQNYSYISGGGDDDNIDELFARLKEELFKNNTLEEVNEMLREENDAALAANQHLRVDAANLSKQLQLFQQQQHSESMRFRAEHTRNQNQVETQHRKLISLWKEFTAVKRQLHELRTTTANDLDRQVTEFTRCAVLMRKAIRHAEQKNIDMKEQMKREKDDVLDETLRQLNSATENYMKSEEKANERSRELKKKDEEIRKLKEQNDEYLDILEQLSKMTYESTNNRATNDKKGGEQNRSQSPPASHIVRLALKESPMDVARKMRKLLSTKNGEIEETKESARQAEKERDRAKKDLEKEERRRKNDQELERKRSSVYSQREHDLKKLEDDLKKANSKIKNLEDQKASLEKMTASIQNSLTDAHRQHKDFIEELMVRHREELNEREESHAAQMKNRDAEEKVRFDKERGERDKVRKENDDLKEIQRALKADMAAMKTELEDKLMRIEVGDNEGEDLKKRLEKEKEQGDRRELEINEYRGKIDEIQEREADLRKQLAEYQAAVSAMEGDTKQTEEQHREARNEVEGLHEQIESISMELEEKNQELQTLRESIAEKETIIQSVRTNTHQLTATYEEANGEIDILKAELTRLHDQLNERTRQISETNEKYDDATRKHELLSEDLVTWQERCEALKQDIEEMNRRRAEKENEEDELRSLLDDLRANFDKLTNDLKQRNITVDSLNDEISMLKEQLDKSEKTRKDDIVRLEETEKKNEAEIREEYESKLKLADKDKQGNDKFMREMESRLNELTKTHEFLIEEHEQLKDEQLHTTEEFEKTKEKLKREIEKMNEQNENDRMEWATERNRIESTKNETVRELQEQIAVLEDSKKEKEDKEVEMKKELDDSKENIQNLQEQLRKLEAGNEERDEDLKKEKKEAEEEKKSLLEQREEALLTATKHATLIDQQNRKMAGLETEIDKLNVSVAERDSSIRALEENTMELIQKLENAELESEKQKDELAVMLKQNSELKTGKEGLSEKFGEERKRMEELSEQLREANKNIHSSRMKIVNLEEKRNELEQNNTVLTNRVKQMELQLMDKSAKNEVSGDLLRKMEQDAQNMLKQAQSEQFRLTDLEKTRKALQDENQRLANDLLTVKSAFEAKRESSKSAISDILVQYRKSEERVNEASIENQRLKGELQTVSIKLDRLENRNKESDNRLKDAQKRYEDVQAKLMNLQRSAVESLQNPVISHRTNRSLYVDIPRASSSLAINNPEDNSILKRTPSVRFADSSQNVQRAVESMDVSSTVGVTLRFLKERLEQLEIDKAELTQLVEKLKDDLRDKSEKLAEKQMAIERNERNLVHVTEEKNTIENRMSSQRQMYLTNEESNRSKEHELRSMKARISSLELHLREKESKNSHLKKEIEVLHGQLHDAIESKEKVATVVGGQESKYRDMEEQLDRALRERDSAMARTKRVTAENENILRKIDQLEREREQLMREITDERRINERNRVLLEEMRTNERNWRNAVSNAKKSAEDVERNVVETSQKRWEESQNEINHRNVALSKECDRLRIEMREQLNRMNTINLKSVDSERKNEELSSKLITLQNTVAALRKFEEEWKRLESEMRAELKVLRKEKLAHTAEIEDLKRRSLRSDTEKKEGDGIRIRLEREIGALKRHVDAFEEEKNRTEKAVRETMNERRAIDKSLASMERENQQLYRNCAQLQSQIQQLERDAGNRSVSKLAKEHTLLEARIAALIEEKRQLQAMLDQRDANYSHKRKLLESQIQLLREQLEAERRKRSKSAIATGPAARRAVQHTSAFRRTVEHRSMSCERRIMEERSYERYVYTTPHFVPTTTITTMNQSTPPVSPISHSDSYTSGSDQNIKTKQETQII